MGSIVDPNLAAEEWALQRLPRLYARSADSNMPDLFVSLFLPDAYIDSPGHYIQGHAELRQVPILLDKMYHATWHAVMSHTVDITGHTATGETYCYASHVTKLPDGKFSKYDWAIRYQDNYARQDGAWFFANRRLIVEWTHTAEAVMLG